MQPGGIEGVMMKDRERTQGLEGTEAAQPVVLRGRAGLPLWRSGLPWRSQVCLVSQQPFNTLLVMVGPLYSLLWPRKTLIDGIYPYWSGGNT